jgi:hypothetical protein
VSLGFQLPIAWNSQVHPPFLLVAAWTPARLPPRIGHSSFVRMEDHNLALNIHPFACFLRRRFVVELLAWTSSSSVVVLARPLLAAGARRTGEVDHDTVLDGVFLGHFLLQLHVCLVVG